MQQLQGPRHRHLLLLILAAKSHPEVIYYYRRIGARGKTPVINQDTLDELDLRSMIKGGLLGGGLMFVVGAVLWFSLEKGKN
jgi:hypothetical protein